MSDPRRLRDVTADEDVARLLGAARADDATIEDRLAIAASIGLTLGAPGAAELGRAAPGASSSAGAAIATSLVKGIVAVAIAAAVGAGVLLSPKRGLDGMIEPLAPSQAARPDPTTDAPHARVRERAASESRSDVAQPSPPAKRAAGPDEAPAQDFPAQHIERRRRSTPSRSAPTADLARETELLAQAQRAIAAHAFAEASVALETYDREAPRGTLVPESRSLRVRLLVERGARSEAIDGARAFLAAFPDSPYAARMRATLRELGDEDETVHGTPAR